MKQELHETTQDSLHDLPAQDAGQYCHRSDLISLTELRERWSNVPQDELEWLLTEQVLPLYEIMSDYGGNGVVRLRPLDKIRGYISLFTPDGQRSVLAGTQVDLVDETRVLKISLEGVVKTDPPIDGAVRAFALLSNVDAVEQGWKDAAQPTCHCVRVEDVEPAQKPVELPPAIEVPGAETSLPAGETQGGQQDQTLEQLRAKVVELEAHNKELEARNKELEDRLQDALHNHGLCSYVIRRRQEAPIVPQDTYALEMQDKAILRELVERGANTQQVKAFVSRDGEQTVCKTTAKVMLSRDDGYKKQGTREKAFNRSHKEN